MCVNPANHSLYQVLETIVVNGPEIMFLNLFLRWTLDFGTLFITLIVVVADVSLVVDVSLVATSLVGRIR